MGEQLSPESRRLSEMVERIKAKWETELPQKIARMKKAEALAKAASEEATWWQEEIAKARAHGPSPEYLKKTEEYAKREWKQSTKEQLKTAWNQIKRSSRFGLLLYMGYLARADLGPLQMVFLAFLAFCFLSWEYQERKELIAETELTMNEQTSRRLAPLEEKQAGLEQLIEETIFILAAVERKTRGATT